MQCSVFLILGILDQGQVTRYFCGISLVMYLDFYNYTQMQGLCPRLHESNQCLGKGNIVCRRHHPGL